MIRVDVTSSYRVRCAAEIDLPMTAQRAWQIMTPWTACATWDPFHKRIVELDGVARVGGRIIIDHRFGPFALARVGRLLLCRQGRGFAFSDLSPTGATRRFPHIYRFELQSVDRETSRLRIIVQGRWTFRIGRPLVRLWLRWVMLQLRQQMEIGLLARHRSLCLTEVRNPAPHTLLRTAP